jgi:hypothetical protein
MDGAAIVVDEARNDVGDSSMSNMRMMSTKTIYERYP